jgi:hypothetical protein
MLFLPVGLPSGLTFEIIMQHVHFQNMHKKIVQMNIQLALMAVEIHSCRIFCRVFKRYAKI